MYRQTIYETDRLYLKILKPNYCRQVLDYYKRNHNFEGVGAQTTPDFYTLAYQKRQLRDEYQLFKRRKLIRFWIFKRKIIS